MTLYLQVAVSDNEEETQTALTAFVSEIHQGKLLVTTIECLIIDR